MVVSETSTESQLREPAFPAATAAFPEEASPAITAASAQLLAWLALASLNQAVAELALPRASASVRFWHHAYDAGHLVFLGAISWLVVRTTSFVGARFGWTFLRRRSLQAVLLGAVVGVVGLATLGADVAGFAERTGRGRALVTSLVAGVAAVALGSTRFLSAPRWWWLRLAQAVAGVGLAVYNGLHLENDYFAYHALLAWLSALLLANSLEGLPALRWTPRLEVASGSVLTLAGCWAVIIPPRGDVRIRLLTLPSSVLAPQLSLSWSEETVPVGPVPARYLASPWFGDRGSMPDVPPSRAIQPPRPPIVLFFTVDAFRADLIENPAHRKRLPNFSRLHRASTYFTDAHPPTTSTMTTMASVFTGKYFSQLLWQSSKPPLIEPTLRFPQLLQGAGVRTALFAGPQGRLHAHTGVALGFTTDVTVSPKGVPARNNVDKIIEYLDNSPEAPLFIYSHFIEPHLPYSLGGSRGTPFERYFAEVLLVDRELGRLRRYLEEKGLAEHTYLIISADHGEAFGEHASFGHAKTVYEEQARVPFFFFLPGRPGRISTMPVTLMDVGPTILDLFGLPAPGHWMGQSLLPVVAGERSKLDRMVALDTGRQMQALYLEDRYKVIFNRIQHTTEVYDLEADPRELSNLAGGGSPRAEQAIDTAQLFFSRIRRSSGAPADVAE